ncbi:MAG TPA: hypothetical protein PLX86_11870, partial [Acidovorax defluvii]|nr:hypothetical protein [Acidovorax defluvii]
PPAAAAGAVWAKAEEINTAGTPQRMVKTVEIPHGQRQGARHGVTGHCMRHPAQAQDQMRLGELAGASAARNSNKNSF